MKRSNLPAKRGLSLVPTDHIFQIRLRNTGEKVDITDHGFLKMLELEYATKYLEQLKIEPTNKNIQNILKRNPLSKCIIQESRLAGGLHTDTITIIHKNKIDKPIQSDQDDNSSEEMIKNIGLKKLRTDVFKRELTENKTKQKYSLESQEDQNLKNDQARFNFDIEQVKRKYIFPFNQTFSRKNNSLMRDKSDYNTEDQGDKLIFESKIFSFPFSEIKVSVAALKQLQTPIKYTAHEIQNKLDLFCSQFPRSIFPLQQYAPGEEEVISKSSKKDKNMLSIQEIQKLFALLRSQQMTKLMGVFLHFAYWSIFGNVNPLNIDSALKKQMYLTMFEVMEYFSMGCQNKRLWLSLYMPMILLTIKMISDYLFRQLYPEFFHQNTFDPNPAGNIATDKILFLVENIFDPSNLNGRFTFLETTFNQRQCLNNDRKSIRKRIYGTSPMVNMIIPNPKNGKARAILAKKHQQQIQQGIFDTQTSLRSKSQPKDLLSKLNFDRKKQNLHIQKKCQEKMLNVVLSKLQSKIESKLGPNQIIKLGNIQSAQ